MVRCAQFYKAMEKNNDFCKKNPETVKRILKHLDLLKKMRDLAAQSEILKDSSHPIGDILSEGAARQLQSLNEADFEKAIEQIIKKAEEKEMDDKPLAVTYKEVNEIVREINPSTKKETKTPKDKLEKAGTQLKGALDGVADTPEAIDSALAKIKELYSLLKAEKQRLKQRREALGHETAATSPENPSSQVQSNSQSNPARAESAT